MALTVGELVGYLRLDGTQFDRQLDTSGRRFEGMGRAVSTGVKGIATGLTLATTATVGLGAAALKVGLDYNRMQQSSRAALTTLLGSAEAANAQMDRLDEFAKNSPFAKQVFIQAQQQLIGFGRSAEDVLPILDAVQNAVAATGGSNQQITELVGIIAKVGATGKLTAQDLIEFGNRGVDAATLIGSQMGKTGAQIREDITDGALAADDAIAALTAGMIERFGGATANIKQQYDGAADRVKAAFRDIGSIIAAPFIDPNGGGRAVVWANDLADAMRALEQKAAPAVDLILNRLTPGLDRVTPALERAEGAINAFDLSKVNGQLDQLGRYGPLIAGTSAAIFALGTKNLGPLQALGIGGINPVVAGIAALVAASPELRGAGRDFLAALQPLVPVAKELAGQAVGTAMAILDELSPALRDLLLAAAPVIVALGQGAAPALSALLAAAVPVAEVVADVAGAIAGLPTPVLAAVTAFLALNALAPGIVTVAGAVGGPLVAGVKTLRDTMAASQAVIQATGGQVTLIGTAALTARVGVSALGTALKTAFISNPIGLAIAAVSAAIGIFVQRNMEAAEAARAHEERVARLADALRASNGVIDDSVRAMMAKELADSGALERARELGLSLEDVTSAALGNEAAVRRVTDALNEQIIAGREVSGYYRGSVTEGTKAVYSYNEQALAARDLRDSVLGLGGATDEARQRAENYVEAMGPTTDATHEQRTASEEAAAAIRAQADAQRDAAGQAVSLREAQIQLADEQDRLNEKIKEGAQVTRDQSGAVDVNAESTRRADEALLGFWRQQDTVTEAMRRNNASAGALDATVRQQRQAFIDAAVQMGYTREEAGRLAAAYGLIPNNVITTIKAEAAEAQGVIDRFITANNGRVIRIRVEGMSGQVSYNYGGRQSAEENGSVRVAGVRAFADGGVDAGGRRVARVPQLVRGGANILWAEQQTGWEAYISGKPSMRQRNIGVLADAASRLGYMVLPRSTRPYADGGTAGAAPAPRGEPQSVQIVGMVNKGPVYLSDPAEGRRVAARTRDTLIAQGVMR